MNRWLQGVLVLGWIPTLLVAGGVRWFAPEPAAAQERTPIKVTRIYTGEDGQTHAEELEVPLMQGRATTELSEPVAVTSVQFRRNSPDYFIDWHTAPRRQYVITLAGESEVEIGDGTKIRRHDPGTATTELVAGCIPDTSCWPRTRPARATSRARSERKTGSPSSCRSWSSSARRRIDGLTCGGRSHRALAASARWHRTRLWPACSAGRALSRCGRSGARRHRQAGMMPAPVTAPCALPGMSWDMAGVGRRGA